MTCSGRTGPGKREVSMFIVEKGTPGFTVGRALKKTGWLSSDTAELVFAVSRWRGAARLETIWERSA